MKKIPDIITVVRIILSVVLLFTQPLGTVFFIIYILCGVSDVLDGFLARKMNCAGKTGALLDSVADVVFFCASAYIFIPFIEWKMWIIVLTAFVVFIRLTSVITVIIKFRTFAFLHTYLNKATGVLLFLFPFLFKLSGTTVAIIILLSFALTSAVEELVIIIKSKTLNRDIKSFLLNNS